MECSRVLPPARGHSYFRVASTSVKASAAAEIKATSRRPIQRVGSAEQSFKRALRVGRHTDFWPPAGPRRQSRTYQGRRAGDDHAHARHIPPCLAPCIGIRAACINELLRTTRQQPCGQTGPAHLVVDEPTHSALCWMLFHAVLALASDDLFPFQQGG